MTEETTATVQKTEDRFTKEFIAMTAAMARKEEYAGQILTKMNQVGIENKDVEAQCNSIIHEYEELRQESLRYIFSFLPEEVQEELRGAKLTGAFCTDVAGSAALSAKLKIYKEGIGYAVFLFDHKKKTCYREAFHAENYTELMKSLIEEEHAHFDYWIRC